LLENQENSKTMTYLINLFPTARHLLLVLALPALAGCQKTLVFFEQTAFKLGISVNEEPPIPLEVTVGLKRRVVAISPPKKPLEQGSPSSEAVRLLSRFDVIYLPDGETVAATPSPAAPSATPGATSTVTAPTGTPSPGDPFGGTLRIISAFASGKAAVTLADNVVAMAAVVDPARAEAIISSFTPEEPPPVMPPPPVRATNAISPAELALTPKQAQNIQAALCLRGDDIDGDFGKEGSKTRRAIGQYQAAKDRERSGKLEGTDAVDLATREPCPAEFQNAYERFKLAIEPYTTFDEGLVRALQERLASVPGLQAQPNGNIEDARAAMKQFTEIGRLSPATGELTPEINAAIPSLR
jgi:hypothetical protein